MGEIRALLVAVLLSSAAVAGAQTPPSNSGTQSAESPKVPGGAGAQAVEQAPRPGVFVNGTLNVPNAPGDTSTTPAKYSATNDRLDQIPLMARGPQLTDAQRKLIVDRVMAGSPAAARVTAHPADVLPASVPMQAWPADVVQQVPDIRDTKFVTVDDKILVVRPESRIVIGEVGR